MYCCHPWLSSMAGVAARGGAAGLIGAAATPLRAAMSPDPTGPRLTDLTAGEAVRRMARGELRAEDYAAALLARCEAGRGLNAFISFDADRVLQAARTCDRARRAGARPGPLFGLPIPVKDSVN